MNVDHIFKPDLTYGKDTMYSLNFHTGFARCCITSDGEHRNSETCRFTDKTQCGKPSVGMTDGKFFVPACKDHQDLWFSTYFHFG